MKINIDKEIDAHRCPTIMFCTVATTCYDEWEREHRCYKSWLAYCKYHSIEIMLCTHNLHLFYLWRK